MCLRDNDISSIKNRLKKIVDPIGYAQNLVKNIQIISAPNYQNIYPEDNISIIDEFIDEIISITSFKWMDEAHKSGKNISFFKKIKELSPLKIHPDHLRNVLINIILNSVDAIEKNGSITIMSYKYDDDNGVIEIVDNGCGIDPDDISKIFSPFYTTKGMKSSGLGLTVSREIIKGYGGKLFIESVKGHSTTAKVILPFLKDQAREKKFDMISETNISKNKVNILYVDDEEGIVDTISEMFELDGFNIISISKSLNAIDIINEKNIDILITDLGMPDINGWDLAKYCREKNPDSYIILATGWGNQIEEDYLSKGINSILSKPYKYEQLKRILLSSGKF
jgi:CheY-like chemotaxis protein